MCHASRQWLSIQPKFFDLRFVAFQSEEATAILPALADYQPDRQLIVLSDDGRLYLGDGAWIMCFYALADYREWAQRLSNTRLAPAGQASV
ncbi:MAG: hypothetical protein GWQ05_22240 [Verrucomicrobiaceae bacterium]|nr:hypothetical protein [Verrucomicrobiaceae bacterium]NCF93652.1 hypothetical protein [Verrucomicrobiaceae bacterium]